MRLPLLATALVAAAALAAPADAALYPVCGTQLAAAPAGSQKWCTTGNTPELTSRANRRLDVAVVAGTVDATIRCQNGSVPSQRTLRITGPAHRSLLVTERIGTSCVATLVAVTDGATAYALSTYTHIFIEPYPVP